MKWIIIALTFINLFLIFFIAKKFYFNKIPPVFWSYDVALLGDSHIYRGKWNDLLNASVANFGKGSNTMQQVYERLPGVLNCHPKICFIHGGINDIFTQVPADTTIKYLKTIIAELKKAGIRPVVIKVMKMRDTIYNESIAALNARLDSLQVPAIEMDVIADDLQQDGLHMQGSGYAKWAMTLNNFLRAQKTRATAVRK